MKPPEHSLLNRISIACCLLLSALLFTRQAIITYNDTVQFGGTDLRVRIVGSRLMAADRDPYFTKWQPGMGQSLCDPNDTYDRPMNGLSVTPFVLWLQQPLSRLSYPAIRLLWWGCQQVLYLFITCYCVYFYRRSWPSVVAVIFCAAALANHPAWILHCERGQLYILLAAWLVILFALWQRNGKWLVWAVGGWMALGILMRPTLALFGVPFLLSLPVLRSQIILLVSGAASLLALLFLSNTWRWWPSYFTALELYINRAIGSLRFPQGVAPVRPAVIEGATNLTRYRRDIEFEYLKPLHVYLAEHSIWPGRKFYLAVCVLLNGGWLLLTWWRNRFRLAAAQMLMLGILLYTSTEICQPFRASYSIVVWLPVVLVAIGYSLSGCDSKLITTPIE